LLRINCRNRRKGNYTHPRGDTKKLYHFDIAFLLCNPPDATASYPVGDSNHNVVVAFTSIAAKWLARMRRPVELIEIPAKPDRRNDGRALFVGVLPFEQ